MKTIHSLTLFLPLSTAIAWGDMVVNERYVEFPNAVPGKIMKATKVLGETDGKLKVNLILDGSESALSLTALETQERAVMQSMIRPLSPELAERLSAIGLNAMVKVAIHLKVPPFLYPDKTQVSAEAAHLASVAFSALQPVVSVPVFLQRYGMLGLSPRGSNILEGELKRYEIEQLKGDADIGAIELLDEAELLGPEITTLAPAAYNPGSVPSGSGSGVRAATFENGLTSGFLSCIGVTPAAYDVNVSGQNWEIRHANGVFRCLVATAPSASFYHRRSATFDGTDDVNYLINNAIQTVSLSATRGGSTPYHTTYAEFLVMDDFAYRSPYPVFINPAGNSGYSVETNWQLYNGISVGNVKYNGSSFEMTDCTQTKNPPPIYGGCISGSGSNCSGDREMPYVMVPGVPSSGSDFASTCLEGAGTVGCGTSWSAGVGNGIAADLIAANSRMVSWPEKVRATMILTAHNVEGTHWASSTDGRDGAGTVSGADGVSFAQTHSSVSPNNSAVEKGMYAGSIYASDFGAGNKRFNFQVPNPKPTGKHPRVVLTWDSNPVVGGGVNALSDLDLTVQKNGGTQGSYSWDGNVEVVDLSSAQVTAGSSYYIDVSLATNRIPSSGSRTNYFYYSVAWAWVPD